MLTGPSRRPLRHPGPPHFGGPPQPIAHSASGPDGHNCVGPAAPSRSNVATNPKGHVNRGALWTMLGSHRGPLV